MGKLEKVRDIYDRKFKELKNPENWLSTLRGISRYYKFNFVETLLIHSQSDNVSVMATMQNWNKYGRYVKLGEHSIAVFTSRTDTKLKYLFDINQTHGKPIEKAWNLREYRQQREKLINRFNAKYGTEYTKVYEVVNNVYTRAMKDIRGDIEKEIEVYKPENTDVIKKFIADSALCIVLSRCGFNIPNNRFDFSAVSEIIPDGLLTAAGNLSMKAAHAALMEIENAIRRNDYEQQIQNQGHRLGVRGEGRDLLSEAGGTDQQRAAEYNSTAGDRYAERDEPHSLGYGEHERSLRQDMGGNSTESDRQGNRSNEENEEEYAEGVEGKSEGGNRNSDRGGASGQRANDGVGEATEDSGNDIASPVGRSSVAAAVIGTEYNNKELSEDDSSFSFPDIPENTAIVKIEWSESPELQDGEIFPFAEINRKLALLDSEQRINRESKGWEGSWYDKTKFTLYAKFDGSEEVYTGRYDIGDGDGTLLHHIELCNGEEASEFIAFLKGLEGQGVEELPIDNAEKIKDVVESENADLEVGHNDYANLNLEEQKSSSNNEKAVSANFHLSDDETIDYSKGEKAKFNDNVAAIRTLKKIEKEKRPATAEEQQALSKYTGWGGLSKAFDKSAANWSKEYIELKALLSEEEYSAALNSTLTSYYTDPELIRPIYRTLERFGFRGGEILDPAMGTGNFFSVLPDNMSQNSNLYGVELDKITGRIARLLYPKADIKIQGFEFSNFEDNTFDVAIGNVPFENYKVTDNAYKDEYMLHDYFFIKTLDKLKAGGIAAFITSSGTLDKFNTSARINIANRAELIGAVRLPGGKDGAFKSIAGTEVTTDIIFLQKREHRESFLSYNMPFWVGSPESIYDNKNHYAGTVNKYYSQHPEMILGEIKQVSGPYGTTAQCLPKEGTDLYEELEKTLSNLQCEFTAKPTEITEESIEDIEEENRVPAADNAENYCFYIDESDILYYRENEYMTLFEAKSAKDEKAIKAMCGLCGCIKRVIDVQLKNCGENELKTAQAALEKEYDGFVKSYGYLNKAENIRLFRTDMRSSLLLSIEQETEETENTGVYEKADIFTKATISPQKTVEKADSPKEALAVSLNLKNTVNISYIARLCGESEDKVISDLGELIFQNPQKYDGSPYSGWETAEEYLSGYVKDKLKTAMMFAEQYPNLFERNVTALRKHQPLDIPISDIDFSVGAVYIPIDMYRDFIYETFDTPSWRRATDKLNTSLSIDLEYSSLLNQWKITNKSSGGNVNTDKVYGAQRMNAYEIMESSLNQKRVTVKDPVEYYNQKGEKATKYIVNVKETQIARDRQIKIDSAFKNWILNNPKRVERIERIYNDRFNNIVVRKYDGSHIKIPGLNPLIELRPHQLNAVARIASGNNVMLAHEVGAGKTAVMAAAGVYMRSIGAVKKPLYVVPKPIVAQWGREFARFFPLARVLITDEKDFEKKNRRKFLSKIATGDFDAVIMSHSQFEKIPLSLDRQEQIFNEKKRQLMEAKEKLRACDGKKAFTVKQYASAIKSLDKKLTKLRADFKKDDYITFEQLGCDYLFADEAHVYKNLYIATKHNNIAGINSNADSQRAFDMDMKVTYLQEINGGGGTTFATGTPISNSIAECYVFQHFLQSPMLKKEGISSFDEWTSVFGNISLALEVKPTGSGWRMRERFSDFKNLPELCNMLSQCFDLIKTKDIKGISLPEIIGEKPEIVVCEQSEAQAEQIAKGMDRARKIEEKQVTTKEDNMLAVCSYMSKVSLDPRINDPSAEDWEGLKVNRCAESILSIHQQYPDSAQVVFCDLSTPNGGGFNVYNALKDRLLKSGAFKPDEIAFVHDAANDKQRLKMFDKVNNGQIKVIIGSTSKLGTGVNMQKNLIAAHHLDAPYVPKDIEQRNGRIIRQGNGNDRVYIKYFSTKGTFDSYRWQLLEKKQRLIAQVLSGRAPARNCKDIDETALTFAEMKAATADNPLIAEKMQVDNEVDRLKLLENDWLSQQSSYKFDLSERYPSVIQKQKKLIEKLDQDIKILEENLIFKDSFAMTVSGIDYKERTDAGNALVVEFNKYLGSGAWRSGEASKSVGKYRGLDISFCHTSHSATVRLKGVSGLIYENDFTLSIVGTCVKIENLANGISGKKQEALLSIREAEKGIETAKAQYGKPFEYAEELNEMLLKQADLNSKLEFGEEKQEDVILDDDCVEEENEI